MSSILALLYGAAVLTGVQAECQTKIQDATCNFVPDRDYLDFGIPSEESCYMLCASHPGCKGYNWRFDAFLGYHCYGYQELEDLHARAGCFSGTIPTSYEGACTISSENLVGTISSESLEDCYQACTETDGCLGYTWYGQSTSFPNFCFQLTDCSSVIPCQGCSSGELNCIEQSITTSTTTIPSTTTTTTTTTSSTVPPQCQPGGYNILNDLSRNINEGQFQGHYCDNYDWPENELSPDWHGPGFYRIQAPAGDKIPTSIPSFFNCGTDLPGWINDAEGAIEHMEVGQEIIVQACFSGGRSGPCDYFTDITVTLCPSKFYVYFLPNVPICWGRFCATN